MQEYINIRPEQNEFEAFTENLGERENIFWLKKDTIKPAIFIRPSGTSYTIGFSKDQVSMITLWLVKAYRVLFFRWFL